MTGHLSLQLSIRRLSLADRSGLPAAIVENEGVDRIMRAQSAKRPRQTSLKMTVASASNTAGHAPAATSVSPVGALSP